MQLKMVSSGEIRLVSHSLRWLLSLPLLLAFSGVYASELIINGVEGELAENIRLLVGDVPAIEDKAEYDKFLESLNELSTNALSALGYYAAEVTISQNSSTQDEKASIVLDITPKQPVRIREREIKVTGPANKDPQFAPVIASIGLREGEVFNSSTYESAKAQLLGAAQDLGYLDFEFTQKQVRVSRKQLSADIELIAESGERFRFGGIRFDKNVLSESFLRRWLAFDTGDPFESALLGESTQNLQNSGYFESVRVKPIIDSRYPTTVPVVIELSRKRQNEVAVGVGYATDTDFRTKLTWDKPLINTNGHSAQIALGLSEQTQSVGFSYRVPRSRQPLYNYWAFDYGLTNDTSGDTDSFLNTIVLQYLTRTRGQWTESRFVRWERETFEFGEEEDTTDLLLPGISYNRSRSRGTPFPTWGQGLSVELLGGSKQAFSTIDLIKAQGTFRYLRALSERNTIITSVQYGAIKSNDYDRVPVSQRFFAGGDRSVRGYGYRELSPLNEDGDAVGGRYLEVLSAEYNYRFRDRWSAALFADAGRAFDDPDTGYSVGAGVGIRWLSPVGPFRVDLAAPVSDNDYDGVRLHLSLGPDL
ncbi:MAG: autotransporter assembly complex protein TamA [Granulosicoccus sp.]|nr:autotransporter assembly complex protein TamA [Granulosicoccus sp.]